MYILLILFFLCMTETILIIHIYFKILIESASVCWDAKLEITFTNNFRFPLQKCLKLVSKKNWNRSGEKRFHIQKWVGWFGCWRLRTNATDITLWLQKCVWKVHSPSLCSSYNIQWVDMDTRASFWYCFYNGCGIMIAKTRDCQLFLI